MTSNATNLKRSGTSLGLVLGCLGFVGALRCEAQNLVPNPSFEEYDTCRVVNDVYYPATGPLHWFSAAGTPDHFLSCLPYATFNSAPYNAFAFQSAQEGTSYAGVTTYRAVPPNIREYFMVELVEPLVVGQEYHASFYAGVGWGGYLMNPQVWLYASGIGMLLTVEPRQWVLNDPYPVPLNFAHVYSTAMITDTVGWTLVSGSFVADSAYQYLMLGNHFDNTNTDTLHIALQPFVAIGYALIDNVCVSVYPDGCPMAVGNKEPESVGSGLYPNPARDQITLQGVDSGAVITIHDAMGRVIWRGTNTGVDMHIGVGHLARGTYIVRAADAWKERSFKFVLIE
jgi:hypothetical protein